jgi:hypothetical protein
LLSEWDEHLGSGGLSCAPGHRVRDQTGDALVVREGSGTGGKLKTDFGKSLVAHLKSCAIALVNPEPESAQDGTEVRAGKVRTGCEKNGTSATAEK